MRQRLFKIMVCVILMVSVFLSHSLIALAADGDRAFPDVPGKYDGSFSVLPHGQTVALSTSVSSYQGINESELSFFHSASGSVPVATILMEFQSGYSYSGSIFFNLHFDYSWLNTAGPNGLAYTSCSVPVFSGSGWTVFGQSRYNTSGSQASSFTIPCTLELNNYSVSSGVNSRFPVVLEFNCFSKSNIDWIYLCLVNFSTVSVTDIVNNLYQSEQAVDGSTTQYYIYEQTKLIEKDNIAERELQQQIADQQAEQSRQQHDEQLHGFQDDAYNGAVSSAGGTVNDYVAAEGELMDSQHQQINDYADQNFNTGLIANYTTAIASVSTWYTQIWMSFGDFKTVFTVILSLGIAAALIGLKRFGGG